MTTTQIMHDPKLNIVQIKILGDYKYLLTYGYGSRNFEEAKKNKDFAVYYDRHIYSDYSIRHTGTKLPADEAVEIFIHTGIKQEEYRI